MIIHYQPLSTIINQPLLTSTNPHKGNVLFPSHGPERSSRSHYCHPRHCSQSAPRTMLMATLNGVIKRSNEKSPPSKWKNSFRSIWRFCFFPLFGFYNFRLINFAVSMVLRYLGSSKFMGRIGPSNLLGDPLKGHWPCPCPPQCEDIPSFHIFPSPIFKWCYVKKMEYPQIHENPRNKWYISYHIIPSYRHTVIPSYRHTVIPSYHHTIIPSYHHTIIPSYHHTSYIIHHTSYIIHQHQHHHHHHVSHGSAIIWHIPSKSVGETKRPRHYLGGVVPISRITDVHSGQTYQHDAKICEFP